MHGIVPDEVGPDSRRIMELRDGRGIGQGWHGDQVFSINSGGPAGGVSTGIRGGGGVCAGLRAHLAFPSELKQQIARGQYCAWVHC